MTPAIKIMFMIILLLILVIMHHSNLHKYNIVIQSELMQNSTNAVPTANPVKEDSLADGPVIINNPIYDDELIRQYDYNNVYDILQNPSRRVPRYELPPYYVKRLIDYPTRGYPDNYTQIGILRRVDHNLVSGEHHNESQTNNFIIRLFGRQQYPGSNKYEYYTMINNGLDQIKIPIYGKRQELYDEDEIYIKELGNKYIISLYRYDEPKYYPDLIY